MEKEQAKGLFCTLRGYSWRYLPKDIFVGIIIAAVSIPIAMGYAEVSGLPPVYGLYGSVLPIIVFAAVTQSRQFILGVDATPAALAGATIASFGIVGGSPEAMAFVPMMALFTCLWLLLFYFLKAGRIVNFISSPVMGGFISGIGVEIILMQIPKLMGGKAEAGEAPELLGHILETARDINSVSLLLGVCSLVIILAATRFIPKFPMPIFVMAAGAGLTAVLHLEQYDVALLSHVDPGFPGIILPDFANVEITHVVGKSLMVAAVVMAETLLAENEFALKNGYKINENREILACALANGAAALTGSCPVNGSISRTSMNDQYGGHTQLVSVVAGIVMLALLFTGTGFIEYLPVPVLTAIVICALMKVVEVQSGAAAVEGAQKRLLDLCGGHAGCSLPGNGVWRSDRNASVLYRSDHRGDRGGDQSPQGLSGKDPGERGTLQPTGAGRSRAHPSDGGLSVWRAAVFCQYQDLPAGY